METVTYTNPLGQSVKFADAPFFIQSVTGLILSEHRGI